MQKNADAHFLCGRLTLICFCLFTFLLIAAPAESLQVNNLSTVEKLAPGESKQMKVTLINDSDNPEQVDLKLADYTCNSDGQHFFEEGAVNDVSSRQPRSNVGWIRLGQDRVTLEPHEVRDVFYTIEVPNDSKLKGSYWSVLLIEPAEIPLGKRTDPGGLQLNIKIRYGHHIVANVGEGAPKLKIVKKEIKQLDGSPYMCLHVLNEGDLFFRPELTLKLYDKDGKLEKTLGPYSDRLYPGNSQCFILNMKELPESRLAEKMNGFVLFDGGDDIVFMDRFTYP